jgi:hypothetical protein
VSSKASLNCAARGLPAIQQSTVSLFRHSSQLHSQLSSILLFLCCSALLYHDTARQSQESFPPSFPHTPLSFLASTLPSSAAEAEAKTNKEERKQERNAGKKETEEKMIFVLPIRESITRYVFPSESIAHIQERSFFYSPSIIRALNIKIFILSNLAITQY